MFIHDLEFFDSYNECSGASAVKGGAIAEASSDVYTTKGSVYASASAVGVGDKASRTVTGTKALFIAKKYYTAGYGVAYAAAYAVDADYSSAKDKSYSYAVV